MPAVATGQVLEINHRKALFLAGQVSLGDGPAQPGVAVRIPCDHLEVLAGRIRGTRPVGSLARTTWCQSELGAERRTQPGQAGSFCEADNPVEPVVVGECHGADPETDCFGYQLLGVRGTVQEAEIGVAVELCIRGHQS